MSLIGCVRDDDIWRIPQQENDILSALRLSYDHLPTNPKQCFVSCAMFPKDYELTSFELIQFWMAQGLLESNDGIRHMEDIGMRHLSEFSSRSFFQDFDDSLYFVTFKMHHLVHDPALAIAKTDDLSVNFDRQHVSNRVRHLLLLDPDLSMRYDHEHDMESSRSLSFQRAGERPIAELVVKNFISSCQYLLSLDLSYSRFQALPKDIKYMVSLRVFWITLRQISLPMNGIGCLRSLRSLCFSQRHNLQCLLEDIENLPVLETLVIVECGSLLSLPIGVRNLTALKSLVVVKCEILNLMPEAINHKYNFDEEQRCWLRLQTLVLRGLPKLVRLPLWLLRGSANTLQSIAIGDCPNMSRLPDKLWNFAALTEMNIENCLQLIETLKMKMDGISPGIAHIPEIHLKC